MNRKVMVKVEVAIQEEEVATTVAVEEATKGITMKVDTVVDNIKETIILTKETKVATENSNTRRTNMQKMRLDTEEEEPTEVVVVEAAVATEVEAMVVMKFSK